ncbi:hypothetical protein [Endozoicomonas elysicola]|nr:hypothetical protein [Endozoicomonas elysicola]
MILADSLLYSAEKSNAPNNMKHQLRRVIKATSIVLTSAITIEALAFQYFSPVDQVTAQQWINEAGFETYSANNRATPQQDRWLYTQLTLQALHTSRPEQFYRYLSKLVITATQTGNDELSQLLQPIFNLNKTQERVFEALVLEQNEIDLAYWLSHYIDLEKRLTNDEDFYSNLFELLTRKVIHSTQLCPEMLILENFKSIKEKRHTILQCIARSVNQHIIDIDISHNRVITSKVLSPEPISTNLLLPPPTVLDNIEYHLSTILSCYDNPKLKPVILLTSPLEINFLVSTNKRASKKTKRPPASPLTKSDINKIRQNYPPHQDGHKRDKRLKSWKPGSPHWLEAWFSSPGYGITACIGIGLIVTLVVIYFPIAGNPYL